MLMDSHSAEIAARAIWLIWCASWFAAALWRDRAVKRPTLRQELVYRGLAIAGTVLLFGLYRHRLSSELILWRTPAPLAWTLIAPLVLGLAFTWWARIHLGRLWSASVSRKADHRVVDSGPYRIVRHPIYSGIILATLATAAMRGTALAWLGFVLLTLGWVVKARLEESFLRAELGREAYDDYAKRVPMLMPGARG
jgi:protein-S-isoprenylcysteine O-methyltransferase Ste14